MKWSEASDVAGQGLSGMRYWSPGIQDQSQAVMYLCLTASFFNLQWWGGSTAGHLGSTFSSNVCVWGYIPVF